MTERYRYGATPEEWDWAECLSGADLLPTVGDLELLRTPGINWRGQLLKWSDARRQTDIAKLPSQVSNDGRTVWLMDKWNAHITQSYEIKNWKSDPALNCSLNNRNVRAFDIDITEPELADWVEQKIFGALGMKLPTRYRDNSSKRAYFFRLGPHLYHKRKTIQVREDIHDPGGKGQLIEFRANECQTVIFGTHPTGARIRWRNLENGVPTLPLELVMQIWEALRLAFPDKKSEPISCIEEQQEAVLRSMNRSIVGDDPVVPFLEANGYIREHLSAGLYSLFCPNANQHTSESGPSSTVWKEADGEKTAFFKCSHGHCEHIKTPQFLEMIGYKTWAAGKVFTEQAQAQAEAQATQIPTVNTPTTGPVAELSKGTVAEYNPGLGLRRDGKGAMKKQFANLADICRSDTKSFRTKMDTFKQNTAIAYGTSEEFRELTDNDLSKIRELVERRYDVSFSAADVSAALSAAAEDHSYDSAIQWINQQQHDGVDRISKFAPNILKAADTAYTHAVSWYLWVAIVGRAMAVEGVKADMVVTIISPGQGTGKSSFIEALVPYEDWMARIDLTKSDDDIARLLRGRVVAELPELKGFHVRDNEAMKAFLDRTKEHYVPKYKEFSATFVRRNIFIGTHNKSRFLTDPTGNRRHLPVHVATTAQFVDWPTLKTELGQYWAQARDYIRQFPSILAAVETVSAHALSLAREAQFNATMIDPWHNSILRFMHSQAPGTPVALTAIATGLLSGGLGSLDFARAARIRNVMTMAKYEECGADVWLAPSFKI